MKNLEQIFEATPIDTKYYIVEIKKKLSHEDWNAGVEADTEIACFDHDGMQNLFDYQKGLGEDRMYNYRVFEKKKQHYSFMQELQTMNQMELIGWLS